MNAFDIQDLEAYFDKIGCRYKTPAPDRMYTGLQCKVPYYKLGLPLQVIVDEHWVTVRGIIQNAIPSHQFSTLLTYLAELNSQFRMVRCTAVAGAVVIQGDLVRSRCELDGVLEMITAVLRYASSSILELSVLVNNDFIATAYTKLQQRKFAARSLPSLDLDPAFDFDISANLLE